MKAQDPRSFSLSAALKAGRSSGTREVMTFPSTTTGRSTKVAPAASISSRILG